MNTQEKKQKIVFIINSLQIGGAERFVVELANEMHRSGCDVLVISVIKSGVLESKLDAQITHITIRKKTKLGIGALYKMYRILHAPKPDVVHTVLFGGDFWGRLAAVLARVPVIVSTEQNMHTTDRLREKAVKKILNIFTSAIVFITPSVLADYRRNILLPDKKIKIIPNGVNLSPFFDNHEILDGDVLRLCVVARLVAQKGHDVLFSALALLRDIPWTCSLVGAGELRASLEQRALELGIAERVRFEGEHEDVAPFLNASDIVLLPSRYEGQGIALLEASAAGCLIVASNTGGIADMFEHQKTAFLSEPGSAEKLADVLRFVSSHREFARSVAVSGQSMVLKTYDITAIAERYLALYRELLLRKK